MKTLPNFFIIGAPKCGTTSLWRYLNQHPEVFLSKNKEPNFFAVKEDEIPEPGPADPSVIRKIIHFRTITDFSMYLKLFEEGSSYAAVGEASVRYLYYNDAPKRIFEKFPNIKMIAVLRDPVSRLYSHYCMNRGFQLEPLSLLDALDAEQDRIEAGWGWDWHYKRVSDYAPQLERYYQIFRKDQLKVILYDDFVRSPLTVYSDICKFLGVDHTFIPNVSRKGKVGGLPKNLALDRWIHWPNPTRDRILGVVPRIVGKNFIHAMRVMNRGPKPKLELDLRRELQTQFENQILALEDLLGRKTGWLDSAVVCR